MAALRDSHQYTRAFHLLDSISPAAAVHQDWPLFTYCESTYADLLMDSPASIGRANGRLDSALATVGRAGLGESAYAAELWVWKAQNFRWQEEWLYALEAYRNAIRLYEQNHNLSRALVFSYKNAAQIYQRLSDDYKAIDYLKQALRVDTAQQFTASIYNNLANGYLFIDSVPAATHYHQLCSDIISKFPDYKPEFLMAGAELAIRNGKFAEAEGLATEALQLFAADPDEADNVVRAQSLLADMANRQDHPALAEQRYREAESKAKTCFAAKSREMAKLCIDIAHFYEKKSDWNTAARYHQKALTQVFPNFNDENLSANPTIDKAYQEVQAMYAAEGKALALLHLPNLSPELRLNAADCFDLAFAIAGRLRLNYGDDSDKMNLAEENRSTLTAAAQNLLQLFRETGDQNLMNRMFALFEQSKAQALRDAVRHRQALSMLPDSIAENLDQIRREIGMVRSLILDEKLAGGKKDSLKIEKLTEVEFRQSRVYETKLESIQKRFGMQQNQSKTETPSDIAAICRALPDTSALLLWFDAGDRYLAIIAKNSGLIPTEIQKDSALVAGISQFLTLLSDKSQQENNPDDYFRRAHFLYDALWPKGALSGIRKVCIIPDGLLNYLPFEALVTREWTGAFNDAPYLLNDCNLSYAWSATWPASKATTDGRMLFAAPFSDAARGNLATLSESKNETPEDIEVKKLEGASATVQTFLEQAPGFGILHLATHARAGGNTAPGIDFYDRTLTVPEIYGQRLHAALVSLSACETGAGKYVRGEGVLSLAYAFAYAGGQSLAASLWNVNDQATSILFRQFYGGLKNGLTKSEAMRQAKRQYLKMPGPHARKAPYYWAPFLLIGKDDALKMSVSNSHNWLILTGAFVLILLNWFIFRRLKRQTQ
jgi:CHAT domain-containing protein